jgi:hypothetical protein
MVTRTTPLTPAAAAFIRATEVHTGAVERQCASTDALPPPPSGHHT